MEFGATGGRGFESAFALYIWGAIAVVSIGVWLWFHIDIRRMKRQDREANGDD